MMVIIAINMTIIKMMMKKKKAWPFMPISDQSERFRARRPETSQAPTFFIMTMMRTMLRRSFTMMMASDLPGTTILYHDGDDADD